jgi:hypothetical protein
VPAIHASLSPLARRAKVHQCAVRKVHRDLCHPVDHNRHQLVFTTRSTPIKEFLILSALERVWAGTRSRWPRGWNIRSCQMDRMRRCRGTSVLVGGVPPACIPSPHAAHPHDGLATRLGTLPCQRRQALSTRGWLKTTQRSSQLKIDQTSSCPERRVIG